MFRLMQRFCTMSSTINRLVFISYQLFVCFTGGKRIKVAEGFLQPLPGSGHELMVADMHWATLLFGVMLSAHLIDGTLFAIKL